MTRSSSRLRARSPRRALYTSLLLAPALLLATTFVALAHPTPATPTGFTSYTTGSVDVVFPSPLPGVELLDHANHSRGVALIIDNIVEMEPGNGSHPLVQELATPANGSAFQPTPNGGQYSFQLGIHTNLPVLPVHEPLWTSPVGLAPVNNSSRGSSILPQQATLVVAYSLPTATSHGISSGLDLSWSIRNWPWLDAADLLGIEAQFEVWNATGFHACPAPATLNSTVTSPCAGAALLQGSILWNVTGLGSVIGVDRAGLTAAFAWGGTESVQGLGDTPVTVGTYFSAPSIDRVTLAAAAHGASNVTSLAHLAVGLPPLPPALVHALKANPWAYAGAAVLFAAIAGGGIVAYRRRESRLREEL